jgi:hypothetical protein
MDWADYLRDQAAKYRQLAETAEDLRINQEPLDLAAICEEAANKHRGSYARRVSGEYGFGSRLAVIRECPGLPAGRRPGMAIISSLLVVREAHTCASLIGLPLGVGD